MQAQDPRLAQWQQRFDRAQAVVKAAEQSKDPARIRSAYDSLRQVQSAKPRGGNGGSTQGGALRSKPKANPRPSGNPFSLIANAMKNAREKN